MVTRFAAKQQTAWKRLSEQRNLSPGFNFARFGNAAFEWRGSGKHSKTCDAEGTNRIVHDVCRREPERQTRLKRWCESRPLKVSEGLSKLGDHLKALFSPKGEPPTGNEQLRLTSAMTIGVCHRTSRMICSGSIFKAMRLQAM